MRINKLIYISGIVLSTACTVLAPRVSKEKAFDPAILGYEGGLKPTFYYTEGVKSAIMYGDIEKAITLFDKAIALDSTHSASYFEAANALMQSDSPKALKYSLRANALDSTNLWYQSQLGRLMLITENYDRAFSIYEKLVRELPTNPENYRLLAALYQQNKQPFSAIAVLDSAEYKVGRMEELAAFKLQLLIDVKLYDKAIAESHALIRDFPYKETNFLTLAQLYAATRNDSLAMENYRKALSLNPTNADVLASLNEYYKRKGDNINFMSTARQLFINDDIPLKSKVEFFDNLTTDKKFYTDFFFQMNDLASTLIIKYPNDYDALELYANHLVASGSLDQALSLYKSKSLDSMPRIEIFHNILDMEAYLSHPDSVAKYSEMALRKFPTNTDLYIRKGAVLSYMKQNKAALATYRQALKHTDSDSLRSVIYGIIGDVYHTNGKIGEAYKLYNRALRTDANNVSVLNNYSYFLSTKSTKPADMQRSLAMAEKAVQLSPNNPTFLDSYAWVLYKTGKFEQAKKIMQQALSLDRSNNSELFIHYGDILYELKEYFMASVYWEKALEKGYDKAQIESRMKLIEGK